MNRHFCQLKISEAISLTANALLIQPPIHKPLFDIRVSIEKVNCQGEGKNAFPMLLNQILHV
jgi:hypothetical protein